MDQLWANVLEDLLEGTGSRSGQGVVDIHVDLEILASRMLPASRPGSDPSLPT
jgi:hypothetical protein